RRLEDAAHLGGRVGFHVPQVELALAAAGVDEEDRLRFAEPRRGRFRGAAALLRRLEEREQAEAEAGGTAQAQQAAARQALALEDSSVIGIAHRGRLRWRERIEHI